MNRDQHIKEGYSEVDSEGDSEGDSDTEPEQPHGARCSRRATPPSDCDAAGMKRRRESSLWEPAGQTDGDKPQDCDEYYFMNLVKMFKKLSPQKKSAVRMKIERLLFEAEFE